MYIKLFHATRVVSRRFKVRFLGVVKYIYDYKIILFSIVYIMVNFTIIKIARNIGDGVTTGLLPRIGLTIVILLLLFASLKRAKVIFWSRSFAKIRAFPKSKFCILLFFLFFSILLCLVRVSPLISNEQKMKVLGASFTDSYTKFEGNIGKEIVEGHISQQLTIQPLQDIKIGDRTLRKNQSFVLVKVPNFYKFDIGQVCKFKGQITIPKNFEEFNYEEYLKNKKIFFLLENPNFECKPLKQERAGSKILNFLVDIKKKLIEIVDSVLNEPQNSLLVGILFGQKRLFSKYFDESVRISGVSHITAASGYNVAILLVFTNRITNFLPKRYRIIIGLIAIWLYALLSGISASIVRASIMTSVSLVALLLGRGSLIHISVPLSALLFTVINPLILFDVGFQLSICAVLGLIYISPILLKLKKAFTKRFSMLEEYVIPTMSCTIATLPVSVTTFKTISLWSIPSNALILPVVETSMLFGSLSLLFWNIIRPVANVFFSVVNVQLKYFELLVNVVHSLDVGKFDISDTFSQITGILLLLFTLVFTVYFYPIKNEQYNYYLRDN